MHAFPGRTAADLYVWIVEHRYYLSLTSGKLVGGGEALSSFDHGQLRSWRRALRAAYYYGLRMADFLSRLLPRGWRR
jgi:hypothetical protein